MERLLQKMEKTWMHLSVLHKIFGDQNNFAPSDIKDFKLYEAHNAEFGTIVQDLKIDEQLYSSKGRQMILADYLEYIFLGRGYYSIKSREDREKFVRSILHFVNLLMCFESSTLEGEILCSGYRI